MLLNNTEALYNPTVHLTQSELMEKFNLAFYEGQNLTKSDILTTFGEPEIKDDYLIDYLISSNESNDGEFDFNDFVKTFDENLCSDSSTLGSTDPTLAQLLESTLDNVDLEDIDLSDGLSSDSLDLDNFTSDLQDLDEQTFRQEDVLPPVTTIVRNNLDFNSYLRAVPEDNLAYDGQNSGTSDFGHLIGTSINGYMVEEPEYHLNHLVLPQNEALLDLDDDPLLSSSSLMYPRRKAASESDSISDEEVSTLQCQWEHCYQIYDSQSALVKHIEKSHVEIKRGEEFTCFWANCPRKVKPFNARYKLVIHMRVHSGEKPNKCPFNGCNKAFSRLENLKIHQRSHTGERPYLCQFPSCTKSFSNSSDRAKHQRTHFDTKPYACQVVGCTKKYTDPSSLRKHVKNHTNEEQMLIKKKSQEDCFSSTYVRQFFDPNRQKAVKCEKSPFYANVEHNYSNVEERKYQSSHIRQDLKNKISEKNKLRKVY